MVTPSQQRECIDYVIKKHGVGAARACKLFNYNRSNLYYQKKMPVKDLRVKELIENHLGMGNCGRVKIIASVRKSHPEVSASKIRRVYEQYGFSLYKRLKKRRLKNPPNPIKVPFTANQEWAIDFMSDALIDGRRFRTLNIIDQFNRKCLGIYVRNSIPARQVINQLKLIIETNGKPKSIRTDNGPEFTSKAFQTWLVNEKIKWSAIEKGKPQQNGIVERFNRTYREDILDASLFFSLEQAQKLTNEWINYYNKKRPHQALKNKTPEEYAA